MNILDSLLASNVVMIICYVFDIILILCAIGLFVWYYIKSSKAQNKNVEPKKNLEQVPEKIDDDTYVLPEEQPIVYEEPAAPKSNVVEHFVNQISEISEQQTSNLKSHTVIVNHEVQMAEPKKKVKKEEISNFVVVGGVNKPKTEPKKTHNVGANAFKNSENFFQSIKDVKNGTVKPVSKTEAKPVVEEKPVAKKLAAKTTAKKTTKTTAKK